jgi:hypothetical protein
MHCLSAILPKEKWCPEADLNHRHADFHDTRIFNPLLYQLSYPGISACLQSLPVSLETAGAYPRERAGL